ncbi:MAG: rhomboid family intramembrane serine protease [Propionibacterium sp.]
MPPPQVPAAPTSRRSRARSEHWFHQPAPAGRQARRGAGGARGRSSLTCTYAIIGICVLVWLAELAVPGVASDVTLTPSLGLSEPWRLLTSAFAHSPYSILHILTNMLMLWLMGRSLEPYLGKRDYLICYLLSAVGGSAVFVLVAGLTSADAGVVGASGAVFGLFGVQLAVSRHERIDNSGIWILVGLNLAFGFIVPGIAWQAHLGGFVTGLAAGWLVLRGRSHASYGWIFPLFLLVPIGAILAVSASLFG